MERQGNFAGAITVNSAGATIGLRNYFGVNTAEGGTISGGISGSGGLTINSGGSSGATLTLTAANGYTGATIVNNSNLTVNGASGSINASSGYTVNGGILTVDATTANADRLKDTAGVTMSSNGGLTLTGNATTNTTETVGTLGIGTGNSIVTIGSAASRVTTLAAASLWPHEQCDGLGSWHEHEPERRHQRQQTHSRRQRRFADACWHEYSQ